MNKPSNYLSTEARREAAVEAVVELAATQHPKKITTTVIAKQMGLTQGAIFKHFASKEAIVSAVIEWVASQLLKRIDKVIQLEQSPLAALEAAFMTHIGFICEHPGAPRIIFSELQRPDDCLIKSMIKQLLQGYRERITGLLEAGKSAGEVDEQVDSGVAATLFIGLIQGLVVQSLLANDVALLKQEAAGVFTLYSRGIRRL